MAEELVDEHLMTLAVWLEVEVALLEVEVALLEVVQAEEGEDKRLQKAHKIVNFVCAMRLCKSFRCLLS